MAVAPKITWGDKVAGSSFSGTEATQLKTVVNYHVPTNLIVTAPVTLAIGHSNVVVTTAATVDLYASPNEGDTVKIQNDSGASFTIDGNGNDIYDAATFVIFDGESLSLVFNNSKWNAI